MDSYILFINFNFIISYNHNILNTDVMNTYQINHIFHSPSLSPLSPTISINSYSQSTLTNKPHHSVTHYLSNIPYNCINHKRRRARYISSLPDG